MKKANCKRLKLPNATLDVPQYTRRNLIKSAAGVVSVAILPGNLRVSNSLPQVLLQRVPVLSRNHKALRRILDGMASVFLNISPPIPIG